MGTEAILGIGLTAAIGFIAWLSLEVVTMKSRVSTVETAVALHKTETDRRLEDHKDSTEKMVEGITRSFNRVEDGVTALHKRLDSLFDKISERQQR